MPPLKYFVPNSFTALSLVLGLGSVAMSVDGNFELAAWMILWGTLLDKLDGTAARLMSATSKFGVEFDSFADFVAFGIAPAALFYFRLRATAGLHIVAAIGAALYVVALAIRLARFNITTGDESFFSGIPGTMMGALLASGYLTWAKYGLPEIVLVQSPIVLIAGAIAMVSTVRLPKLKVRKSKLLNAFQGVNVLGAYVVGPLMIFPEYLFALAFGYLTGGLIVGAVRAGSVRAVAPANTDNRDAERHSQAA